MKSGSVVQVLLMLLVSSAVRSAGLDEVCPSNATEALNSININLDKGNWVDIDILSCPEVQADIQDSAKNFIESGVISSMIPLMSDDTMRIVRNTVFAIKGYKFKSSDLQEHFNEQPWYEGKYNNAASIALSEEEKALVDTLKQIENEWNNSVINSHRVPEVAYHSNQLPPGVRVSKDIVEFDGGNTIDISPYTKPTPIEGNKLYYYYDVQGYDDWGTVLVCLKEDAKGFGVDFINIEKMNLYSAEGVLLNEVVPPLYTESCPSRIKAYDDILLGFAEMGCCGAIDDVLITYDRNAQPLAQATGDLVLFDNYAGSVIYFIKRISDSVRSENRSVDAYGFELWRVNPGGLMEKLSDSTTEFFFSGGSFTSFGRYELVNLYEHFQVLYNRRVSGSIVIGETLVVFWYRDGTTIIPLAN